MDDTDKRVAALSDAGRKPRVGAPVDDAVDARVWAGLMSAVARRADRAAFMRIYDHFAPRLRRYLLGLGATPSRADELVQDALLAVWRKSALFDPARASLDAWLFRIARNLFIDEVRREPHWRPIQEGLEQLDAGCVASPDPAAPEGYVDQRMLAAAIERLPAMQARLVRMSYLEARSHREIALETGMPLGSVKSAIHRAVGRLRSAMGAPA